MLSYPRPDYRGWGAGSEEQLIECIGRAPVVVTGGVRVEVEGRLDRLMPETPADQLDVGPSPQLDRRVRMPDLMRRDRADAGTLNEAPAVEPPKRIRIRPSPAAAFRTAPPR